MLFQALVWSQGRAVGTQVEHTVGVPSSEQVWQSCSAPGAFLSPCPASVPRSWTLSGPGSLSSVLLECLESSRESLRSFAYCSSSPSHFSLELVVISLILPRGAFELNFLMDLGPL